MRVHDSQAYRKMDVTRERISRILELRKILLSFKTGSKLVNAAVVCAVLESTLGWGPSSVITDNASRRRQHADLNAKGDHYRGTRSACDHCESLKNENPTQIMAWVSSLRLE